MEQTPDRDEATARAEAFLTAFNAVEQALKERTGLDRHESFRTAAHRFVKAHRWWERDFEAMLAFADLRNVIVHERYDPYEYLSIPSTHVLEEIQAVRDRLLRPTRADEAFAREVASLEVTQSVLEALREVGGRAYTQFPVYQNGAFRGLVTGNGIAHWLAHVMEHEDVSLLDFAERTVGELLDYEEPRNDHAFAARDTPAEEVLHLFAENAQLEAVLVTEHGRSDQKPLGIATRWDVRAR